MSDEQLIQMTLELSQASTESKSPHLLQAYWALCKECDERGLDI